MTRRWAQLTVWPDLAIYWTLDNFLKSLATIDLPKSPTFLGNFCKVVKIYQLFSEIILGNFYRHLTIFFESHWKYVTKVCLIKTILKRFFSGVQSFLLTRPRVVEFFWNHFATQVPHLKKWYQQATSKGIKITFCLKQ